MNPITKALDEIKFRIPRDILNEVFQKKNYSWRATPISVDEQILTQVIKARVLVDCNLVGGTEAFVSLEGVPQDRVENFISVYHIPKDMTQGRSIMSVLSISYISSSTMAMAPALQGFKPCSVTPPLLAGQAMMDAMGSMPITSSAKVQLIGENTIMVKDTAPPVGYGFLRCVLANDENMSHIQMRSIPDFCKLCELACKSYIYNEYAIILDRGQLFGGHDIGRFKEIVDGYADVEEMYQDFLKNKWQAISFMNDQESFERFIKLGIGSYR
jgi:hypothetical protein